MRIETIENLDLHEIKYVPCCFRFQLQEHKRKTTTLLQPATCNPIFKRFISKLLKEISKLDLVRFFTAILSLKT